MSTVVKVHDMVQYNRVYSQSSSSSKYQKWINLKPKLILLNCHLQRCDRISLSPSGNWPCGLVAIILNREEQWHKRHKEIYLGKGLSNVRWTRMVDCFSTYHTSGTGHFVVFLVASDVTNPKNQMSAEDREIQSQRCKLQFNSKF